MADPGRVGAGSVRHPTMPQLSTGCSRGFTQKDSGVRDNVEVHPHPGSRGPSAKTGEDVTEREDVGNVMKASCAEQLLHVRYSRK